MSADAGIRVLHVDVESELAELVAEFLERADDRIAGTTASSVDAGLDALGADVTVRVGDLPDGFYVADDGAGISESARDEVFEAATRRPRAARASA
jgi:hypothetical protein